MQSTLTNITTICQIVGRFRDMISPLELSHLASSCLWSSLDLSSHWLMMPEPESGPDSARDGARVLFYQLAVTSSAPGPTQLPLAHFQETLLRTLPWLMSIALPIVTTVTQRFMMFLWVIPLAINLINRHIFQLHENSVLSCKEKWLLTLSFYSMNLDKIHISVSIELIFIKLINFPSQWHSRVIINYN